MNIHEYQAKRILEEFGVFVPEFAVVSSLEELEALIKEKGWHSTVLKAQIHAGGRGKGGGVKVAYSLDEMLQIGKGLLGKTLVTPQTGPRGLPVQTLLVSPLLEIVREMYVGLTIDREKGQIVLLVSPVGGMEIEKIADEQPSQLLTLAVPPDGEFRRYHLIRIAHFMGWQGDRAERGALVIQALLKAFRATDAVLLEINPLIETEEGQLYALDAKLVIDDNALFRQPQLKSLFDASQVEANEARAQKFELAYVSLDGDIGCMVNGAGLAMATMDLLHHCGGKAANFLDVGGGASEEKISEGFQIILSDPKVKAVLVNIFGGIMNCETLAAGIIAAAERMHIHVPLVIRLEGTHADRGKHLLRESGLNLMAADSLADATQQVVKIAKRTGDS